MSIRQQLKNTERHLNVYTLPSIIGIYQDWYEYEKKSGTPRHNISFWACQWRIQSFLKGGTNSDGSGE